MITLMVLFMINRFVFQYDYNKTFYMRNISFLLMTSMLGVCFCGRNHVCVRNTNKKLFETATETPKQFLFGF